MDFDEQKKYGEQLAIEAVTVGALFIPWSFIVSGLVRRMAVSEQVKSPLSIFLAGASFHLVAEATGLNEYYLKNSAAHMLSMRTWAASCKSKSKNRKKTCGIRFSASSSLAV